jgi:RNA polymerase sigma factor (TIGR02999 family)
MASSACHRWLSDGGFRANEQLAVKAWVPLMMMSPEQEVLSGEGTDALFKKLYSRLKSMAHRELRKRSGNALNTTALVHEVYLKLVGSDLSFDKTGKFFAYAALSMRHILVNEAKRRLYDKNGGGAVHIDLADPSVNAVSVSPMRALQLDAALNSLGKVDERAAQVVELHFFSGLPLAQVAELLGVVRRTIDRDWRYARAYLMAQTD